MHFNFSIAAVVLAAMSVAVEAAPKGGANRGKAKQFGKDHGGDIIGGAGTAAGFLPSNAGKHVQHNCCVDDGGWQYNKRAADLTVTVCKQFSTAQMYNNACTEAAGSAPISGDAFYNACKNQAPGDNTIGAGYRATC